MVRTRATVAGRPGGPPEGRPASAAAASPSPEPLLRRLLGWLVVAWLAGLVARCVVDRMKVSELRRVFRDALGGPYDWSDAANTWLRHGRGLAVAALWCLAALGWGRPVTAWLGARRAPWPLGAGLGLLALGLATWGIGLLGLLVPAVLAGLAAPALLAIRTWRAGPRPSANADAPGMGWPSLVFAAACGGFLFIYLWPAFAPELGWDALTYHLRAPSHWLAMRRIAVLPFSLGSFYPFLAEMWFMLGQALGGDDAAKLLNFAFLPLTAFSLAGLGASLGSATAGWFAALVYVAQPPAGLLSSQCYNDLEIAFLTLLAVDAAMRPGRGWRIVSAVLCGGVMGCKYSGLLTCAVAGSIWIRQEVASGAGASVVRRVLGGIVLPTAVAGLIVAPWPLRDWFLTGNPVYPMAPRFFPGDGWNPFFTAEQAARIVPGSAAPPLLETARMILRLPYDFSVNYGAIGVLFTPLVFGLLPALVLTPGREPSTDVAVGRRRLLTAGGMGIIVLWILTRGGDPRYLIPAIALLSVPVALGAARLVEGSRLRGAVLGAVVVAALAMQAVHLAGYVSGIYVPWRVAVGAEPRRVYLCRAMLPNYESYPFAELVNARLPKSARVLLFSDIVSYYLDPLVVFDTQQVMPPIGFRLVSACREPSALRRRFRQLGLDWVIYTSRIIAFEKDCRCLKMDAAARDCYRAFWRRYAEPVLDFGSIRLFRLRGAAEAAQRRPAPFIAFPGVQDPILTVAEEARQAGRPLDAAAALRRLVREEPDLADARFKLAEVLLLAGRVAEAKREAAEAHRLGLDTGPWWVLEGGVCSSAGDHAGAYEATRKGAERWRSPRTLALLAAMSWNAGKPEEARRAIREALSLNPWDGDVRRIAEKMGR
ncbi:MAG: hypothetical protein AAB152_13020 [Candidatus Coatesbacteria bacterium]